MSRAERGQAIVLFSLLFGMLLMFVGLSTNVGQLYSGKRSAQSAADAAALAGATVLYQGGGAAAAVSAAEADASRNGYAAGVPTGGTTVTVNTPPVSGPFAGNANSVEVIILSPVQTSSLLSSTGVNTTVRARAVGGLLGPPPPRSIIALSKTASPALSATGNAQIEAEGAGISVNSSAATAMSCTGGAQIEVDTGTFDVVGGASVGCASQPLPTTGAPAAPDPLAYLGRPSGTGLTTFPAVNVTNGTTTIGPGIYPSISVSGNGDVKMQPGTYVIKGGGISVTGNGKLEDESSGDGQGVFVFNACADFPATTGSCGAISVGGNGRLELEKTTSGTWTGISIWQPCENTQTLSFTGGGGGSGGVETSGTVYTPCAGVSVTGNDQFDIDDGQLVASTVTVTGNGQLEVEWETDVSTVGRIPALVE